MFNKDYMKCTGNLLQRQFEYSFTEVIFAQNLSS